MEKYYRTFIGLPFQVQAEFLETRQELIASLAGERISWVEPERYHVTIRFLGDTEQPLLGEIGKRLRAGISIPDCTLLKLNSLGSFGPRKRPRVLWVGFEETDFFELIKTQVDLALEQCGISRAEQPFRAHLTLGRVRSMKNIEQYYNTIQNLAPHFQSYALFEKLVFFRSILGSGGPDYQVLEEIRFRQDSGFL